HPQARNQGHLAVEKRRIGGHRAPPVLRDRLFIRDAERVRRGIEPHGNGSHRKNDVGGKVEAHAMSSSTTTGQWSEAFGRSQPVRGKRSTSCPGGKGVRKGWPARTISGIAAAFRRARPRDSMM